MTIYLKHVGYKAEIPPNKILVFDTPPLRDKDVLEPVDITTSVVRLIALVGNLDHNFAQMAANDVARLFGRNAVLAASQVPQMLQSLSKIIGCPITVAEEAPAHAAREKHMIYLLHDSIIYPSSNDDTQKMIAARAILSYLRMTLVRQFHSLSQFNGLYPSD